MLTVNPVSQQGFSGTVLCFLDEGLCALRLWQNIPCHNLQTEMRPHPLPPSKKLYSVRPVKKYSRSQLWDELRWLDLLENNLNLDGILRIRSKLFIALPLLLTC